MRRIIRVISAASSEPTKPPKVESVTAATQVQPTRSQRVLLDVTDLVEFLQRQESVSGVQRVVAETTPLLVAEPNHHLVVLDRGRGEFVQLTSEEERILITEGTRPVSKITDKAFIAQQATATLNRAKTAESVVIRTGDTLVFLGALWINDSLMLAARDAHAQGAKVVDLLYDLTPVLETGHTAGVNKLFDRYLTLIAQIAARVPAISQSSRRDFEVWCAEHGYSTPPGSADRKSVV